MGYKRPTTPCIDALRQESINFSQAYAVGPYTPASFPAILTSTYPLMHGGYGGKLAPQRVPLAEVLSQAGWHTAAVHSNPFLSRHYGYERGFDLFIDGDFSKKSEQFQQRSRWRQRLEGMGWLYRFCRSLFLFYEREVVARQNFRNAYWPASRITAAGLDVLEQSPGDLFLWLHFMDVHQPYHPPQECLAHIGGQALKERDMLHLWKKMNEAPDELTQKEIEALVDLYDASICYADQQLARFFAHLKERGLYDDALIIVTADHGEEFYEHGGLQHREAKLYDELVRVPLVVKLPQGEYGGVLVKDPVSLLDLAPTVLDLANLAESTFKGESLKATWEENEAAERTVISQCFNGPLNKGDLSGDGTRLLACRVQNWKLIYHENTGCCELYDLAQDPLEKQDLAATRTDQVDRLKSEIKAHISLLDSTEVSVSEEPGGEEILQRRLQSLGYL
jgi:arylsulfatase A-like enzyme